MALEILNVADCKIGLLKSGSPEAPFQATWGTAEVDGANALELSGIVDSVDPDYQKRSGDASLTGTRNDDKVNHHTTTNFSAPTFTYKSREHIGVLKDEIHALLAMHLQNVDSEGAISPYEKAMTPHNTSPDFTVNAGYFGSFVFKKPSSSNSLKLADIICAEKLGFSISPGGYLQCEAIFRSRGAMTRNSNPSGTWARAPQLEASTGSDLFHFGNLILKIDYAGSDETIKLLGDLSFDTSWNAVKGGHSGGDFETWVLTKFTGNFSALINYDTHSRAIQAEIDDNDDALIEIILGWDGDGDGDMAGDADGDLKWTLNVHLTEAKDVTGENGIYGCQLSGVIVGDIANTTEPYSVVVVDDQDMGY